jgi:hypothetical protein
MLRDIALGVPAAPVGAGEVSLPGVASLPRGVAIVHNAWRTRGYSIGVGWSSRIVALCAVVGFLTVGLAGLSGVQASGALASSPAARAAVSRPVYVAAHCGGQGGYLGGHVIRPRTIYLACGGTLMLYFTGVSYSSYGGPTATGRGTVFYTPCSAACFKDARHEPGTFTLSDIQQCSDGRLYYTKAVPHAPGVPTGGRDAWEIAPQLSLVNLLPCTPGQAPPVVSPSPPPATTGPPRVTGTASAGATLSCSGGSVTLHATRVVYRWLREGRPIPGVASRLYRVREVDEGTTLVCDVTAYSGSVVIGTVVSRGVRVAAPFVSGCPAASGSLQALLRLLGATRAQALGAFAGSSSSGQENEDFFCLTPVGVLVGYPPAGLLSSVPAGARGRFAGRVIWMSTSNEYYSILGVGPGTPLATAGGLLKLTGPFDVGSHVWYLAQDGSHLIVLIVRGGVVVQVGLADWSLAGGRAGELALIRGLQAIYQQSVHVSGPLQALDSYWAAIGARNFAGAFGYLLPGLIGSEASFVSSEQHEHVQSAQFQGRVTSQSGNNATIQIVSLITHDEQYGCRTWSGSYRMTSRAGRWLISRANIAPRPCTR